MTVKFIYRVIKAGYFTRYYREEESSLTEKREREREREITDDGKNCIPKMKILNGRT